MKKEARGHEPFTRLRKHAAKWDCKGNGDPVEFIETDRFTQ